MSSRQIENSFLQNKVDLRLNHLPTGDISVLDMYSADGKIWDCIKESLGKRKVDVVRMDCREDLKGVYLKGDNLKYLKSIGLRNFNVIDLDAFGVPYRQLKILFDLKFSGAVFATFIQSVWGGLPADMLSDIGYPRFMVRKCPSLFYKNGFNKFMTWLALNGIKKVIHRSHNKKHYVFFRMN